VKSKLGVAFWMLWFSMRFALIKSMVKKKQKKEEISLSLEAVTFFGGFSI